MTLREHARLAPFKNDFLEAYRSLQSLQGQTLLYNELGVPRCLEEFCRERDGLFIVTAPTGGGKSTTLATMIDIINHSREGHIITIEDPVEYIHKSDKCNVNQREVGRDAGRLFRRKE